MTLQISNIGRFRLGIKLRELPASDRSSGKIRGRIIRKLELPPESTKDLGNGQVIITNPNGRSSMEFEEAEVDLLEPLLAGPGWTYIDDNEDPSPEGYPSGWVPDLEQQIKKHRE